MAKDPAFLFYSKEFYEGTRTMLPEERACYLDLLMYQHQHGEIPFDTKRLLMYCSGISEATLEATLEAKFKRGESGYYNDKLRRVIADRAEYKGKQSDNGIVGQFFKKAKKAVSDTQFKDLREYVYGTYGIDNLLNDLKKPEATHEAMLEALLKHLSISISDSISDKLNKGVPENPPQLPAEKSETPRDQLLKTMDEIKKRPKDPDKPTMLEVQIGKLMEIFETTEARVNIEREVFNVIQDEGDKNEAMKPVLKSAYWYMEIQKKECAADPKKIKYRSKLTNWLKNGLYLNDYKSEYTLKYPAEVQPMPMKDRN